MLIFSCREMTTALNPNYHPLQEGHYQTLAYILGMKLKKKKIIDDLTSVPKVALTSDGWTNITQDHYVIVTVHYVKKDQLKQNSHYSRCLRVSERSSSRGSSHGSSLFYFQNMSSVFL